jgi:hypothetical protein
MPQSCTAYKNKAAKPPATAAKLMPTVVAPAFETEAGLEPVEVLTPLVVLVPEDAEGEAVAEVLLAATGFMVALYEEQVAFGESGQVASMQMAWSCMP